LGLFHESLAHGGVLALGSKESIQFAQVADFFKVMSTKWKIFQKTSL